MPRCQSVCESI